jgi:hypothetical protein
MLNYRETTRISTNVPLPVPCASDQMQGMTPSSLHVLSALLEHPEFQQGLAVAQEEFDGEYELAPLTEEAMIKEVEMNLSRRITERCHKLCQLEGWEPSSYLWNLGFVVGVIDKGLTYAH